MDKRRRSPEFDHYCRTFKCPNGHSGSLAYIEGSGEIVSNLRLRDKIHLESPSAKYQEKLSSNRLLRKMRSANHSMFGAVTIEHYREDSMISCAVCSARWPVFLPEHSITSVRESSNVQRKATDLGVDRKVIDHSKWIADSEVGLEFERGWTRRIEVSWESASVKETSISTSVSGAIKDVGLQVGIRNRFEESLRQRYSSTSEERRSMKHTMRIPIPAGSRATVTITWKQIWEVVDCSLMLDNGAQVDVNYQVAVDVDFDQTVEMG